MLRHGRCFTFIKSFLSVIFLAQSVICDLRDRNPLPVKIANVSPLNKPFEQHSFSIVPVFHHGIQNDSQLTFSEVVYGNVFENLPFAIRFKEVRENVIVYRRSLNEKDLSVLRSLIAQSYVYEIWINDLRVRVPVGFRISGQSYPRYILVTHFKFILGYSADHVTSANVNFLNGLQLLSLDVLKNTSVTLRYSVQWVQERKSPIIRLYSFIESEFAQIRRGYHVELVPLIAGCISFLLCTLVALGLVVYLFFQSSLVLVPSRDQVTPKEYLSSCFLLGVFCSGFQHILLVFGFIVLHLLKKPLYTIENFWFFVVLLTVSFCGGFMGSNFKRSTQMDVFKTSLLCVLSFYGPPLCIGMFLSYVAHRMRSSFVLLFSLPFHVWTVQFSLACVISCLGGWIGNRLTSRALDSRNPWDQNIVCIKINHENRYITLLNRYCWMRFSPTCVTLSSFVFLFYRISRSLWGSYTDWIPYAVSAIFLLSTSAVGSFTFYNHVKRQKASKWNLPNEALAQGICIGWFLTLVLIAYYIKCSKVLSLKRFFFFFGYLSIVTISISQIFAFLLFVFFHCLTTLIPTKRKSS